MTNETFTDCSGRDVHSRHSDKLPDHVRERGRRGGVGPRQDRHALPARLVPHRPGGGHPLRPAALRHRHRRSEPTRPRPATDHHLIHTVIA